MIRAKFRCMSVTVNAELSSQVKFLPVYPKSPADPEGCLENRKFWDATPNGEAEVLVKHGLPVPFQVGHYYYIDMERVDDKSDGLWDCWEVVLHDGSVGISLGLSWNNDREFVQSSLKMDVNNKETWPVFLGAVASHWRVTFTPAEK